MRPANGISGPRAAELCVPHSRLVTADVKGRPPRQGSGRAGGPGVVLPILPYDSAERALALERFAADMVGQLGAAGARFLAALLDEQAAEADAHR